MPLWLPGLQSVLTSSKTSLSTASELLVNGKPVERIIEPPFVFHAPLSIADGASVTVGVRATDTFGAVGFSEFQVTQKSECNVELECAAPNVCVESRCTAGPDADGGLGTACDSRADCNSGICTREVGNQFTCAEPCSLGGDGCPDGFSCREDASAEPRCLPGNGGGCGCGQEPSPYGATMLLFMAWFRLGPSTTTNAPRIMELRSYAEAIIRSPDLATKLDPIPSGWTDREPGPPLRLEWPARSPELTVAPARATRVPPVVGMADKSQRIRILHALANHELMAAELFAWALLAFPDAPAPFRRGLLTILGEEQTHCRMYIERLEAHGSHFGAFPVTGHFWNRIGDVQTPLEFICTMGLTFENANLDFAQEYAQAARATGDEATAAVLMRVHEDEIRHVAFAWRWHERWKQRDTSSWEAYKQSISWPLSPGRARGRIFDRQSREQAGLSTEFIEQLESEHSVRPSGARRTRS